MLIIRNVTVRSGTSAFPLSIVVASSCLVKRCRCRRPGAYIFLSRGCDWSGDGVYSYRGVVTGPTAGSSGAPCPTGPREQGRKGLQLARVSKDAKGSNWPA
eukprot:1403393-Pyramimonas_sp.AAC.1